MTTIAAERLAEDQGLEENTDGQSAAADTHALVDVEQLIRELDAGYNHLPEAALRACQANRELVIPRLIEVLQQAVRHGREGAVRIGNAPIFALFLLAEFEATEALSVVMDFVKLPHDIPDDLLGESLTTDLPRILAIFAGDRIDLLDELIGDAELNQYVRWSASDAYAFLVRDGRVTRQEAICRLRRHLARTIEKQDVAITALLIVNLLKLNANEARGDIEEAFRQGVVETFLVNMDCVNRELRLDQPDSCNDLECRTPTKIADTVAEMRDWHWPGDKDERQPKLHSRDIWPAETGPWHDEVPTTHESFTISQQTHRVGRNDPCPCGSGKKYKKCCLRSNDAAD